MKKLLTAALIIISLMLMLASCESIFNIIGGNDNSTPGVIYDISADGTYAEVMAYNGISKKVRIAAEYQGLPVKNIYSEAFKNNESITSVVIPDSVVGLGDSAFYNCTGLTSVTIGNSVTSIGDYAFEFCRSLTSVTIPDSVTTIGNEAFFYCTSLTSMTIPNSVTSIGYEVFCCTNLTSVTIGNSVTSIGNQAFSGCYSLTSINVSNENTTYKSINGNLYSKDGKTLIQYAIGKTDSSFIIPDSVVGLGDGAFYECASLTSVTIPKSVTSIGSYAFSDCTSLTSIKYRGTQAEWDAISKDGSWDYNTGSYTITYNYTEE